MNIYWIDLFAGAGGTTTGIHMAEANAKVIACVNHDKDAIAAHQANHPNCLHLTEDIRDFQVVVKLKKLVDDIRKKEPNCIINIWASLECTNFSNAKGGLPRDADSRTLAEHLLMYIHELNPHYLYIENVREFMAWGPLDKNGKPLSRHKGEDYEKWKNSICDLGYIFDFRILNSADYGAYTARRRFFGVFGKKGLPISFPEPTHYDFRKTKPEGNLKPWKPVREVLQLEDKGKSIFERKKPLATKTLVRYYKGLRKFVKDKESIFMSEYYGNGQPQSIDKPMPTIPTKDRFTINHVVWITDTQYGNIGKSVNQPAQTLIARMDKKPLYIASTNNEYNDNSIETPGVRPIERLIRYFMRKHGIKDCCMRMAHLDELKVIQGFPKDYILKGTKTEKLKQIGNAVVPHMSKVLIEENYKNLKKYLVN